MRSDLSNDTEDGRPPSAARRQISRHVSRDVATFCFAKEGRLGNSQAEIRVIRVVRG